MCDGGLPPRAELIVYRPALTFVDDPIMELLQSPLNLAHQEGRRADRFLAAEKYEKAIECHQKAADLLLKAIESTSVESALCSLRLQRERHLQQKKVIRYKQQVAALTEAADDDPTQTSPPDLDLLVDDEGDIRHSDLEKSTVYQTIEDCDSLLQFLNKRAAAAGRGIHQADTLKALLSQNNAGCQGVKVPKDDKMIIEELRLHNIALLNHIADLLKETEGRQARLEQYEQELNQFRLENYELKEKLQRLQQAARGRIPAREDSESDMEHSTELYPFPSGMNLDDLPILRLPPLEMPKFDFDSLKIASNKCSEDETPPP